jgi:transcriptional regulator with XRE-family HTH domain
MPEKEQKSPTPLGRVIENYIDRYNLKQQQLADYLCVDVRTLRRWISGETIQSDVRELKRLADKLGVEPESLGVSTSIDLPLEPDVVHETVNGVWFLIREARYVEARAIIEKLIQQLESKIKTEDHALLRGLARAHQAAGHVTSETSRTIMLHIPLKHYQEMEHLARTINDDTLLNLALTYQGDMLRRQGNVYKAITYLQAACETAPLADVSARGNAMQLLSRAFLQTANTDGFESAMSESKDLTYAIDPQTDVTNGLYNLSTVYEEYARSYATLGRAREALDYLDLAEKSHSLTGHWETLLKTARAWTLVYNGDTLEGAKIAVEAADLCYKHGAYRHLERIYSVQAYLDRMTRKFGNASTMIRDALQGPVEFGG